MSDISDLDLLKELGEDVEPAKVVTYSPAEARLIAGFEDIIKFTEENDRAPQHGEDNDIFERLYAVRLDQLRKNPKAQSLLVQMDGFGLLKGNYEEPDDDIDDAALLAELGAEGGNDNDAEDITQLRHVAPLEHRRAAEEVANREVCRDFKVFEPLFKQVRLDLENGIRSTIPAKTRRNVEVGAFFILSGQLAYIADKGDSFKDPREKEEDARLRVVFDNGTESNLLLLSLLRALRKDDNGRAISKLDAGPLFGDEESSDNQTGTIYVLKSLSSLPEIEPIKDVILKIGVTGGDVKRRIANAKNEATYLLGDVEVIDEYKLYNINRVKLERLIQRVFQDARLNITIKDRFGNPVQPTEWFLVPREAVAKAVELIRSGEITNWNYVVKEAKFGQT